MSAVSPLRGVSTVNFLAADHAAATKWYTEFLGWSRTSSGRATSSPDRRPRGRARHHRRRVRPGAQSLDGRAGVVVYWHIDDVDAVLQRAVSMGATQLEAPQDRGHGFITATAVDPFGNILGIMFNPHYVEMLGGHAPS